MSRKSLSGTALKIHMISVVQKFLYKPVNESYFKSLKALVQANNQIHGGYAYDGFYYRGAKHVVQVTRGGPQLPLLHETLSGEMDAAMEAKDEAMAEEHLVMGYLRVVCSSETDPIRLMQLMPHAMREPLAKAFSDSGIALEAPPDLDDLDDRLDIPASMRDAFRKRIMLNMLLD